MGSPILAAGYITPPAYTPPTSPPNIHRSRAAAITEASLHVVPVNPDAWTLHAIMLHQPGQGLPGSVTANLHPTMATTPPDSPSPTS